MSREAVQSLLECAPGCRSRQHGLELNMAVMRGTTQQVKKYLSICFNCHTSRDKFGRTPLHIAASVGYSDLVDWMINSAKLDPNVKDLESGWTALHRAAFYGELAVIRRLLRHQRVNVYSSDKEGCSPFDLLQRDLPRYVSYNTISDGDVYSWGDNVNFVHGTEAVKRSPELVEYFARQHISVRKVLFSKFHAVFISACGRVYSCGHGLGGRLGTGQERTLVSITPVPLPAGPASPSHSVLETEKKVRSRRPVIVDVALGDDHTVLLTESGVVFTCGLNVFGQLGHSNVGSDASGRYSEPRPVKLRVAGGEDRVVCIAAAKYHSVLGTAAGVYTCGLNAGQLGHARGERLQPRPRLAPGFGGGHAPVIVAASVGATVVYTKSGDIYALHRYECKKVARWADVRQLCVSGGQLDPSVHSSTGNSALTAGGGDPLIIAVLTGGSKGQASDFTVALWQAACGGGFRRVRWAGPGRVVDPLHAALSPSSLALVTAAGEAFLAPLSSLRMSAPGPGREQMPLGEREEVCELSAKRVPLVHRAVYIAFDRKAKNFAVVQASPGSCITKIPFVKGSSMTQEVSQLLESGDFHDVVLKIGAMEMPCHKFILAAASDVLEYVFTRPEYVAPDFIRFTRNDALEVLTFDCPGLSALAAECLVEYFYRGTCRLLTPGFCVPGLHDSAGGTAGHNETTRERKKGRKKKDSVPSGVRRASMIDGSSGDPIRALTDLAKRLNMKSLVDALSHFCMKNNVVELSSACLVNPRPLKWIRNERSTLCDAVLVSEEDGARFPAHRCLLAARMDYFRMMFSHSWQENCEVAPISLRMPGAALALILEYIYTDGIDSAQMDADNAELLCTVLAAAEVYQCRRLKDLCEELLAARLSLRNVADVVELASFYNAGQLTLACHDFMHVNAIALLEGRMLENLPEALMDEFTSYYKRQMPPRRRPVADWPHPSPEHLELVDRTLDLPSPGDAESGGEAPLITVGPAASQKRRRRRPQQPQQRSYSISSEEGVEVAPTPEAAPEWRLEEEEFPNVDAPEEEEEEPARTAAKPRRGRFKTLSQKERRRLQREEEEQQQQQQSQEAIRKPTACPWGPAKSTATATNGVVSLRDVMKSQEEPLPSPAPVTPVTPVTPRPRRTSSGSANPWGDPASPSSTFTFAAIVQEQENLDASAARLATRPFELIQTEERAMQELKARVFASLVPGEMNVRVEFVRGDAAPPVWRAKA